MVGQRIKSLVADLFYKHGQFCSAHPWPIITFVCAVILVASYPTMNLPLPGTAPTEFTSPVQGFQVPVQRSKGPIHDPGVEGILSPRWFSGPPVGFIQQFVINATVLPWKQGLIPEDAFRSPLAKAFELRRDIEEYQTAAGKSVRSFCLYVMEPTISECQDALPKHNCLMVSPASIWGDNEKRFHEDAKLVNSIFKRQGRMETVPSIKDLLFGIPSKYTGISRFYIRSRQRQISFAITLVLQTYNQTFIGGLKQHLLHRHGNGNKQEDNTESEQIIHIYQDEKGLLELSPLIVIYVLLLLYIYFSISKIEMVESKWGMAFAAVIMIMASMSTSVGICLMFGLTPSLSGSEIFPYLVIVIGLENILVFTKSVVSTPVHLAVNVRIAQGLSKEGWSITKNLCAELLVVFIGFFTFVPAIQEFCVFALVGLLTDFFLQMLYFVPVLSVDIRRMELSDLHRKNVQELANSVMDSERPLTPTQGRHTLTRSKSAPRSLNKMESLSMQSHLGYGYLADSGRSSTLPLHTTRSRVPRRLRFIYFWASTRLMQRLIMAASILWIILTSLFMYKSGLVTHLTDNKTNQSSPLEIHDIMSLQRELFNNPKPEAQQTPLQAPPTKGDIHSSPIASQGDVTSNTNSRKNSQSFFDQLSSLTGLSDSLAGYQESLRKAGQWEPLWRKLSMWHWPTLFGCYNISLHGKYISILPPQHLSITITPEEAIALRHDQEKDRAARWYGSLDPDSPSPTDQDVFYTDWMDEKGRVQTIPLYRASQLDYYMTMTLGILSGASLVILIILIFKCVVLVRLRRARYKKGKHEDILKRVVMKKSYELVPWVLVGHQQEIECLSSEGAWIASCCLGGEIRIWDGSSGECTICIDRQSYFKTRKRLGSGGTRARQGSSGVTRIPSYNDVSPIEKSKTFPLSRRNGYSQNQIDFSGAINTKFGSARSCQDVVSGCQDDKASGVYSTSVESPDPSSGFVTPGSSGNGYDFKTVVDAYLMQEQYRYNNQNEDEEDEGLDDVYPDLSSPPLFNKLGSHSRGSVDELADRIRPRTASAGSVGLRVESSHSPPAYWDWNPSPTPYASQCFSFDEELVKCVGPGANPGPLSSLVGAQVPPVWCMVCNDHMVVVGCSNGRIEMWDPGSGFLLGSYTDNPIGVTGLSITGSHLIVARLNGSLEFLELVTHHSVHINQSVFKDFLASSHRAKFRSWSTADLVPLGGAIFCSKQSSVQAHQQPINDVQVARDQVVTASQDHTLKVFRLEDSLCTYTLRGHTESVTTLCVDKSNSYQIASGSNDGMVRLWDTLTGACLHSLWGHVSTVLSVTLSRDHVISVGMDNRLCVWKRRSGRMIHLIQLDPGCSGSVVTLSSNLMVTGGQGYLAVWDIIHGEPLRVVELGSGEQAVRQIVVTDQGKAVVCDYGHELRLVTFPSTLKKTE